MKKNVLIINSSSPTNSFLSLIDESGEILLLKKISSKNTKRPNLLLEIDKLLKKGKLESKDLEGLIVVSGPGHFSFLRTGISIANTFGFVLKIPVAGIFLSSLQEGSECSVQEIVDLGLKKLKVTKKFVPVIPEYGREPNITKPKK